MTFINPMLLETVKEPFSNKNYLFEIKADGHRMILSKDKDIKLFTRNNNLISERYPELHDVPINGNCVLDGELVVNRDGLPDFELTMKRFSTTRKEKIDQLSLQLPVCFMVFDILKYKNRDTTSMSLHDRKKLLYDVLPDTPHVVKMPFIHEHGEKLFDVVKDKGMEGMVAKWVGVDDDKNSSYEVGKRSKKWLKIINWQYTTVYLSGYRKNEHGWIASIKTEDGKFRNVGIIEYGGSIGQRKAFYNISKQLITKEDKNYVYIEPVIKVKVKYRNLTSNNLLRIPTFIDFDLDTSS